MTLSLYDAFVPSCQQVLAALQRQIDKAEAYANEHGIAEDEFMGARLADDMWNLPWHIRSCWVHSAYVLTRLPTGEFSPDFTELPQGWEAMRAMVAASEAGLAAVTSEELEAVADKPVGLVLGGNRLMEMTGSNFLLSFSQPNFYFHATTFYGLLRMKGVPLGKRDFLGKIRVIG